MIPFASQRASGQDLATHLHNEFHNETVEVVSVRGAIARDLHGAFAEWEALAHNLTRCVKYLYSLSINPDPAQGPLTREQYADYIRRVEDSLDLVGQPRVIVFHSKPDGSGIPREHCHVVWSRIDAENEKAVHIAFDREKLMAVTREFARDHGLRLPDGYNPHSDEDDDSDHHSSDQLSLYEKIQEDRTGLTKEQRMVEVTAAWQQSDTATAFVHALEELGYVLANGRRPYVLVDRYGEMNALPKLIDDRAVRSKDVCAFLENDFPPDSLPGVDEARLLIAQHWEAHEGFDTLLYEDRRAQLNAKYAEKRVALEKENATLVANHAAQDFKLAGRHQDEIMAMELAYRAEMEIIRSARRATRASGLAAFLGRVTGMAFVIKKLRQRKDCYRHRKYLSKKAELKLRHNRQSKARKARQQMQCFEITRRLRILNLVERREQQSLETEILCEGRIQIRAEALENNQAQPVESGHQVSDTYIDLQDVFDRAASDDQDDGDDDGEGDTESRSPHIKSASKTRNHSYKCRTKKKGKNNDTDSDRCLRQRIKNKF